MSAWHDAAQAVLEQRGEGSSGVPAVYGLLRLAASLQLMLSSIVWALQPAQLDLTGLADGALARRLLRACHLAAPHSPAPPPTPTPQCWHVVKAAHSMVPPCRHVGPRRELQCQLLALAGALVQHSRGPLRMRKDGGIIFDRMNVLKSPLHQERAAGAWMPLHRFRRMPACLHCPRCPGAGATTAPTCLPACSDARAVWLRGCHPAAGAGQPAPRCHRSGGQMPRAGARSAVPAPPAPPLALLRSTSATGLRWHPCMPARACHGCLQADAPDNSESCSVAWPGDMAASLCRSALLVLSRLDAADVPADALQRAREHCRRRRVVGRHRGSLPPKAANGACQQAAPRCRPAGSAGRVCTAAPPPAHGGPGWPALRRSACGAIAQQQGCLASPDTPRAVASPCSDAVAQAWACECRHQAPP